MSGVYGTVRPANINPQTDVELYYHYRPTRSTDSQDFSNGFKPLDSSCLVPSSGNTRTGLSVLKGMYSLRLPLDKFNSKGIYTIYIKPRERELLIQDVSILENFNNPVVQGIVINTSDVGGITDLSGYRVEYYDQNGNLTDTVRLITSSNPCEPVKVTISDSYSRSTRYRITNVTSNSLLFCTLTPSTASSYKPNSAPSPGYVGQTIHIINTKFNPVMMEIEMVDHDADTISTMLEGTQIRDLDNGLITTYDKDKQIYLQQEYYTLKSATGTPLYDVKQLKSTSDIDTAGQSYDNIITE